MDTDKKIAVAAEHQHGLVTSRQLRGMKISRDATARRVRRGTLLVVAPGLYRLHGVAETQLQRALAAVLDAGRDAALSHDSAAALFGIPRFTLEPLHVWRRRGRADHDDRLAIQHRTRRLMPWHVMLVEGIPATTPTRLIFDQAACLERWAVERLLDDTLAMGLTNYWLIDRMGCSLSRQGRTGLALVRDLNEARGPHHHPAESNLERRTINILEAAGLSGFARQVDIEDEIGWIARVDLRHRAVPLVIEVQSDRYHAALLDRSADQARIVALERAGYVVVEAAEHDVWHRPEVVVSTVAEGLDQARRLRASGPESGRPLVLGG